MSGSGQIIRVLLADDHPMVREGLAALINRRADMRVISEVGAEALRRRIVHLD